VDAADYVAWRNDPAAFGGDPDGYNTWRANFGSMAMGGGHAASIAAVPEPAAWMLAVLAAVLAAAGRRRST
jgi:hypothetical protein